MTEEKRKQRNRDRIKELYPAFGKRIERVIRAMESEGFRPRIQAGWRSPAEQLEAFNTGHSKLKYGFHNVTSSSGRMESLAVDMLDDDFPVNSRPQYLLCLAWAAEAEGLTTGIRWGVPKVLWGAIDEAIALKAWKTPVKIGWDPTHIEPRGLTPGEAKNGARPN